MCHNPAMATSRPALDLDDLAEIWEKVTPVAEEEGMRLAYDELRAMRDATRGTPESDSRDASPHAGNKPIHRGRLKPPDAPASRFEQ